MVITVGLLFATMLTQILWTVPYYNYNTDLTYCTIISCNVTDQCSLNKVGDECYRTDLYFGLFMNNENLTTSYQKNFAEEEDADNYCNTHSSQGYVSCIVEDGQLFLGKQHDSDIPLLASGILASLFLIVLFIGLIMLLIDVLKRSKYERING